MDIIKLIEDLEEEFGKTQNSLFGRKSHIDVDKCIELLDELKRSLPSSLQEARYVLSQKDKIIAQANELSEKTLKEAEMRAEQLVSESELVKKSEQEANEIMDNANKRCSQLYNATRENIDKMLKAVEDYMLENLHVVRSNRETLNGGSLFNKPKKN